MKQEDPASGTCSSISPTDPGQEACPPEIQVRYLNMTHLAAGTTINDRYRVEKPIGKGGFGMVFAGYDLTLKSEVALKFFNPDSLRDEKKFLRVQREINLSRRISDPRIVRIYSLENWRGLWFMVMELVRGETLKERLLARKRFAWEEFQPLFLEILRGVESLHGEGIIHRDLKPSNIMVDLEGKIKILDFGLAKEIGDLEKTSSIGEIVGSPFYLSPEQIQGQELDVASDVYQLGVLLFQALTGAYPFADTSTMGLVLMHLNHPPDRIADRGVAVPEVVEFAVNKALAKKKQERFRSVAEMAERLRQGSVPLLHSIATRVPRALRLAALAVATLSLAAAAYFATYGSRQVRSVQAAGTAVSALNRFGRTLWQKDFAPYSVHLSHLIRAPGSWYRPDQQNPVKNVNDTFLGRLQHQRPPVTLAFLSHPAKGVFARDDSVNSDGCDNQLAVLGPNGKLLDRRSYSESFGLRAYDFAQVFNMNSFRNVESGKGGEKLVLFHLQNFQGMYPSALVIGKGTSFSVLCSPGVILDARVLRNDAQGISMLVLAANNLFSHMNYLTEWNCSPLASRHTEIFPAYFTNHNYTTEEFPVFFPRISGIMENHWLKEGRVVLFDTEEGRTITVFRDGKLQVTRDGKVQNYCDLPAVLVQAYGLVNECFQQKDVRRNPQKALELAADAATLPVQNPYLRSALLCLRGECEARLGRYAESRESLRQALDHFPRNNDAIKRLLEIEFFEKGAPAAIALFERAYSQGKNFFGLGDTGNYLFLGYAHLAAGQAEKAREYFETIYQVHFPDSRETLQGILEMFAGNYEQAVSRFAQAESKVPGFFDIRELRLLLARSLVLAGREPGRARRILEDLAKYSLRQGHMAEVSLCYLLAREGKTEEIRERIGPVFARLKQIAAGDFETRLWFWYDAFLYARTMEILGDRAEARRGYQACLEANPHIALAADARKALDRL